MAESPKNCAKTPPLSSRKKYNSRPERPRPKNGREFYHSPRDFPICRQTSRLPAVKFPKVPAPNGRNHIKLWCNLSNFEGSQPESELPSSAVCQKYDFPEIFLKIFSKMHFPEQCYFSISHSIPTARTRLNSSSYFKRDTNLKS